ncbi:Cystathionine beta-lyase PatB [Pseudomonas fluorescens]|uniref:MalY/PatB family protein n=1 Tax=Pseudomonas fluorescens TaxID=294 RepID=UPI00125BDC8D|nr:MalY/PatB family protein [Pseudomonas fluorescens]VVO54338.1 Cystathionine beta-lyase PatB [Pseudomonas fluorescens]
MANKFDTAIDRRGTSSMKWASLDNENTIAVGLADMDFPTADAVVDEVMALAKFGIHGYATITPGYYQSFIQWCACRYEWEVKEEWLLYSPGIIAGMGSAVRALTEPGDHVIYQTPGFYLLNELTRTNDRVSIQNPLVYADGRYSIDFEDLEAKASHTKAKMLLLCNPQNPTGRVYTRNELQRIADICLRHHVLIVSDEVHCDMVFAPHKHIPIASLGKEIADITISCLSPTKTFNMAGLQTSVNVIPNPELRGRFEKDLVSRDSKRPNIFAHAGFKAAYEKGEAWLDDVTAYIKANTDHVVAYTEQHIPEFKIVKAEGTYLVWIDCSAMQINGRELREFFLTKANVLIFPGIEYGEEGRHFIRLNPACARSLLTEVLDRMAKALAETRPPK